jgi:hypothetical protein
MHTCRHCYERVFNWDLFHVVFFIWSIREVFQCHCPNVWYEFKIALRFTWMIATPSHNDLEHSIIRSISKQLPFMFDRQKGVWARHDHFFGGQFWWLPMTSSQSSTRSCFWKLGHQMKMVQHRSIQLRTLTRALGFSNEARSQSIVNVSEIWTVCSG